MSFRVVCFDLDSGRMTETESTLQAPAQPSSMGLQIREGLTFAEWSEIGSEFGRAIERAAWCIGDWLVYGNRNFSKKISGEAYDAAIASTRLKRQTLMNYASVCKKIPKEARNPSIPFTHHAVLAALPEHSRIEWMDLLLKVGRLPSVERLSDSLRISDGEARIVKDHEILNQPLKGADNYTVHIFRATEMLRDLLPKMNSDQIDALTTDSSELFLLLQSARRLRVA